MEVWRGGSEVREDKRGAAEGRRGQSAQRKRFAASGPPGGQWRRKMLGICCIMHGDVAA